MIIAVVAVFGLIFGSFINAFVWRFHQLTVSPAKKARIQKSKKQLTAKDLSIVNGRSMCPQCHHELAAKDLVPVLSWLMLRGKCRYCQEAISVQYPLVELLTAGLFVVSYIFWPLSFNNVELFRFVMWQFFVVAFVALAVYDLRWLLLPDRIVYPLVGLAAVQVATVAIWQNNIAYVWHAALGAAVISGLFYFLFQISNGGWIGGGDVKLGLVLGLLAGGPIEALLVIFFASVYGTLYSLPLLARSKSNFTAKVPFGPFLLAATITVQLFGVDIANWYTKTLL